MRQYGASQGIVCINMHDNEQTAVQAAEAILKKTGGMLIRIGNQHQRNIRFRFQGKTFSFDANRIFSPEGIEQTLKENGRYHPLAAEKVKQFADRLLQLIPEEKNCIVALHNNFEGHYSVRSYLPGGERETDARMVSADSLQDPDDIVFTTHELIYKKMAEAGFNAILQDNDKARKDGSLSVYCGEQKLVYANIETQHGKTRQYELMMEKLLELVPPGFKNIQLPATVPDSATGSTIPAVPAPKRDKKR